MVFVLFWEAWLHVGELIDISMLYRCQMQYAWDTKLMKWLYTREVIECMFLKYANQRESFKLRSHYYYYYYYYCYYCCYYYYYYYGYTYGYLCKEHYYFRIIKTSITIAVTATITASTIGITIVMTWDQITNTCS